MSPLSNYMQPAKRSTQFEWKVDGINIIPWCVSLAQFRCENFFYLLCVAYIMDDNDNDDGDKCFILGEDRTRNTRKKSQKFCMNLLEIHTLSSVRVKPCRTRTIRLNRTSSSSNCNIKNSCKYVSNAQKASEIVKTCRTLESGFPLGFFLFLTILLCYYLLHTFILQKVAKKGGHSSWK